ncbi:TDX [Hepatospora eriocheir]|uniref:TDX n=1 Tax=Hepatospora eriocheir TaxID=1081669 RepID=A0A1X0QHH9_9MICR|nr:TDX [Hepatospora eriocheir]
MGLKFSKIDISNITLECYYKEECNKYCLGDIKNKYILIMFYPKDFSTVCPTELLAISSMADTFKDLDCQVLFVSTDSIESHKKYCDEKEEVNGKTGIGKLNHPMLSDPDHKLCEYFDLYNEEENICRRGTVIIHNESSKLVFFSVNCDPIGRNSKELVRVIKAYDSYLTNGEMCPIDFKGTD